MSVTELWLREAEEYATASRLGGDATIYLQARMKRLLKEYRLLLDQQQQQIAQVAAKALREAAEAIDWEWEVFVAQDGNKSIRMHGKTPSELLCERAAELEEL